ARRPQSPRRAGRARWRDRGAGRRAADGDGRRRRPVARARNRERRADARAGSRPEGCDRADRGARLPLPRVELVGRPRLMAEIDFFRHSTPELYARYMGPLLFAPYAEYVAKRAAGLQPRRILEPAAGTGIVTRAVSAAVPKAEVVATDINPAVVEFAARH